MLCTLRRDFSRKLYLFLQASGLSGGAAAHPLDLFWEWVGVGFQHTDPKSYSNINVCRREAPSIKYGDPRVSHAKTNSIWQIVYFKQFYNAIFASFIFVDNDVQLRIALVILWARHFLFQTFIKFQLELATAGGRYDPSDPSPEHSTHFWM